MHLKKKALCYTDTHTKMKIRKTVFTQKKKQCTYFVDFYFAQLQLNLEYFCTRARQYDCTQW